MCQPLIETQIIPAWPNQPGREQHVMRGRVPTRLTSALVILQFAQQPAGVRPALRPKPAAASHDVGALPTSNLHELRKPPSPDKAIIVGECNPIRTQANTGIKSGVASLRDPSPCFVHVVDRKWI